MPLPALASYCKIAFVQQSHGVEIVNTLNCYYPLSGDPEGLAGLGAIALTAFQEFVLPFQSYQLVLGRVELRQLIPGAGVGVEVQAPPDTAGDNIGDADNTAIAAAIKLATAQTGRSYRGRWFVGGLPNNVVQNGLIDETYLSGLAVGVGNLITTIRDETTANPVILSYFSNGAQRVTPVATTITNAIDVTPYPALLHSRQRRPG